MDWEVLRGNLTTSASQSISYDSSKGTPKALAGVILSASDLSLVTDDATICKFFWDGSNQTSAFMFHSQDPGGGDTRRGTHSSALYFDKNTGTNFMNGSLALDGANNEFDLTFSNAPNSTYEYVIWVMYGDDVEAECLWFDGNDQQESPGFEPSFYLFAGASTGSAEDTSSSNAAYNSGVAGSDATTPTQACIRYGNRDNDESAYAQFSDSNVLLNMFEAAATESVQVDSVTSTTFDISLTTGSNEPGIYLAVKCDNEVDVSIRSASGATGTQAYTGVGFEPGFLLVGGAVMDAVDTAYVDTNGANFFEGMVDLVPETPVYASWFITYEDNTASKMQVDHSNLIFARDWVAASGTANEFAATVSATSSDGFTINRSTADDNVQFWVLSIAPPATNENFDRSASDGMGLTDSSSRSAAYGRSSSDAMAGTDSDSRESDQFRAASDDAVATDTSSRTSDQARSSADSLAATDEPSRATAQARSSSSSSVLTDSASGIASSGPVNYERSASDSFGFTDSSSRLAALLRSSADAVAQTDSSSRTAALGRSASDSVAQTDEQSRTADLARSSADSLVATDAASRVLSGETAYERSAQDSFALNDSCSRTVSYITPPITGSWYDTDYNNLASSAEVSYYGVVLHDGKLAMAFTPDGSNAHTHFIATSEDAYSWTDYEVTGSLKRNALTGIGVTVFSDYPNSDTYYRLRTYQSSNQWYITKHPDGQLTDVPVTALSPTDQWLNYRILVQSGGTQTTISAKLWVDGSAEPAGWQAVAVDSDADRIQSGTVGYWAFGTSGGTNYHADLRINLFDGLGFRGVPVEGQGSVGTIGIFLGSSDLPASSSTSIQALSFAVQGTEDVTADAVWYASNPSSVVIGAGTGTLTAASSPAYCTIRASYQGNLSDPVLVRIAGGAAQTLTFGDFEWDIAESNLSAGEFIGGDPYVVAPSGPIAVIGYRPAPSDNAGRNVNGSMVNPGSTEFLSALQGYSARDGYQDGHPLQSFYDVSLDAGRPNGTPLSWTNPLFLYPGESHIVSMDMTFPAEESVVDDYGVLTVLAAAPASPSTTFRPQPYDGAKTLYTTADYDMDVLPEWDATAAATVTAPTFADVEALITGTHIHAVSHWVDRYYRSMTAGPPKMQSRALHWSRAILRLCCGVNTSQKEGLLNKFLQLAIDQDGARAAGFVWEPSGGEMFGSKAVCYFKAKLFGETIPTDGSHWSTNSGGYHLDQQGLGPRPFPQFQEDAQTFIVGAEHSKQPSWSGYSQYQYGTGQFTMAEWGGASQDFGGAYWASPPAGVLSGNAWTAAGLVYTDPSSLPGEYNRFRTGNNFACLHGHYLFIWHIIDSGQGTLEELRWRVD